MHPSIHLALFIFVTFYEKEVEAECCHPVCGGICADCTIGTPFCAYGKCNIFGCNCDDGCRPGAPCKRPCPRGKRDTFQKNSNESLSSEDHLESIFASADLDRDGLLNESETKSWLARQERGVVRREVRSVNNHFREMDLNGDGFLSKDEIDN